MTTGIKFHMQIIFWLTKYRHHSSESLLLEKAASIRRDKQSMTKRRNVMCHIWCVSESNEEFVVLWYTGDIADLTKSTEAIVGIKPELMQILSHIVQYTE